MSGSRWGFVFAAIVLIVLGVLQNPQPVGFETRPSSEIPSFFFAIFAIALILDVAAVVIGILRIRLAAIIALFAAIFNVLPPLADQVHILHSAPTPVLMLVAESLAVVVSALLVGLGYVSGRPVPLHQRSEPKKADRRA